MPTYALTFLAGALTVINPCVLPLLPIVLGSAFNAHKYGLIAFATGMAIAFAGAGIFLAALGLALDISPQNMRQFGAIALIVFGLVMLVAPIAERFSAMASTCTQHFCPADNRDSLYGQFTLGALMGIVWAPCTGPAIGAAFALALQGVHLIDAALRMALFGLGAVIPILLLGTVLRPMIHRIQFSAHILKYIFGMIIMLTGVAILLGWDKMIEAAILSLLPNWWVDLSVGV